MVRKGTEFPHESINLIFNEGGLGDNIARMSCVKYLRDKYKHITIHLYVPDYFLELAKHLVPNIIVRPFTEKETWNKDFASRRTWNDSHTNMRSHLVDSAFHLLADEQVDIQYKNYCKLRPEKINIKHFNLPKDYVVVTTGFTAEVREMLPSVTNTIINYLNFKKIIPVFLGSKLAKVGAIVDDIEGKFNKEINYNLGIDLIDKTTLLEAGKIIAGSKAIVGLDCGLLHLAGCTEVPIVASFTSVEAKHRLPYRHNQLGWNCYPIEPPESLKCRGCQSKWNFIFDFDFRKCYYVEKGLDNIIQCVNSIPAELYIEKLEKIL